jgi:pyridoxamine 5'-phosphate oxidase
MTRYSNLDSVLNHVWEEIEAAAETHGHPYRHLTFGSVHEQSPDLRTVVLRRASETDRRLQFHSDRRSQKVRSIRANDRVAWLGWDADSREQIRLYGWASVHLDDEVARDLWEHQSPSSLAVYARPTAPGTAIDAPDDRLRPAVKSEPVTEDDVAQGRQYFAAIQTTIDLILWLHLHPDGHYRARFEDQGDEETFEKTWVVP